MGRIERKKIIEKIEAHRNSKLVCYITSDRFNLVANMQKDILPIVDLHLRSLGEIQQLDVMIVTLGGDILTGFGLAQLFREYSKKVGVLLPDKCQSAGTLFALGADEIFMNAAANLSPIDPSTNGPLNPQANVGPNGTSVSLPLSVESVAGFKSLAQDDWKLTEEGLSKAFSLLCEKVHPLALGNVFRTREQIELLAEKLLKQHRTDEGNISQIVTTLTKKLGSHDYLIYRTEAKKLLGDQVKRDVVLENLMWELFCDFQLELELGKPYTWKQTLYDKIPVATLNEPIVPGSIFRKATVDLKTIVIESLVRQDLYTENIDYTEYVAQMNYTIPLTQIAVSSNSIAWKTYT